MVPKRQLLRKINAFATSSIGDMHQQLDPFYSAIGRPSIDSELLNRMPIVGYCFGIRFGTGGWVSGRWLLSKSIESQGRLVTKHRVSHRKLPMRCACNAEFRPGGKGRNSRRLQLGIADRLRESHKPRRQQLPRLGETRAVRVAAEHRDQPLRGLVQIHVLADEPRIAVYAHKLFSSAEAPCNRLPSATWTRSIGAVPTKSCTPVCVRMSSATVFVSWCAS